jgi:hypothetical protein
VLIGSYVQGQTVRGIGIGFSGYVNADEAVAIGPQVYVTGFQGVAIGYYSKVKGSKGIAIGSMSRATVQESLAIGYNAGVSGIRAVAIGRGTNVTGQQAVAIGNLSFGLAAFGTAVGAQSRAYAANSTAIGSYSWASNAQSVSLGNYARASGNAASALGPNSQNRVAYSVNLGGPVIVRKDNGEAAGIAFQAFNGVCDFLFTKEVDLKTPAAHTLSLPAGCHFWVEEVGLILTTLLGTIPTQPTIQFGVLGTPAKFLGPTLCTLLTATFKRERFSTLLADDGEVSLRAEITVGAAGSAAIKGRFYFKGVLIEDA